MMMLRRELSTMALCLLFWWSSTCTIHTTKASTSPSPLPPKQTPLRRFLKRQQKEFDNDESSDVAVSTTTTDEKKPETNNSTGVSWWPLSLGTNKKQQNETATTTPSSEEEDSSKKKSMWSWRKKEENSTKDEDEAVKEEESKKKPKKEKEDSKKKKKEEDLAAQNQTATTKSNTTSSSSEKQPSQVIVMGGPPPPNNRGGMPAYYGSPQQREQQQRQMRNAAIVVDLTNRLMSNALRLGIIFWSARHFKTRQETISPIQHFVFERLNDRYVRDSQALKTALDEPPLGISNARWKRVMGRRRRPQSPFSFLKSVEKTFQKTVIVLEYGNAAQDNVAKDDLDLNDLADLVSFLLAQHEEQAFGTVVHKEKGVDYNTGKNRTLTLFKPVELEVVFKINSPGGGVAPFGLAAAQVTRLRRTEGIATTVCVDKIAASGGYMIASQADKLVAAPFASVGSVGVILQTLNFHDILRQYGVQPLVIKAGEAKVPITTYGAITKKEIEITQEEADKTHKQFQEFTIQGRPQLAGSEDEVCNGSVYMGQEAVQLNLVDEIMTSDEYLMQRVKAGDRVLKIHKSHQSRLPFYARRVSAQDILPHLKTKIENLISRPDIGEKLVQVGSLLGFLHHLISNYAGRGGPANF